MGWPLRDVASLRRVRRLVHLPDGRRPRDGRVRRRARVRGRRVLGARRPAGVQDAPARLEDPRAAASGSRGARRRSPRAATTRCPSGSTRPGSCSSARAPGSSTCRALEGRPLRDRVGLGCRRRGGVSRAAARRGRRAASARSTRYDDALRASKHMEESCTRCGTCARRSTRASSSAARSRAR